MLLKISIGTVGLIVVLAAVIGFRTLRVGPPSVAEMSDPEPIVINVEEAARRLGGAIGFRTVSHGPDEPPAHQALHGFRDFLFKSFPNVHETLKQEVINQYSLLYTWEGSDLSMRPILLSAHMDVVPVEPGSEAKWTYPPFSGAIADGHVWGRGAMDMKASLLGILEAAEYLIGTRFKPVRTVYLAFSHDEEIGGSNGAAKIAKVLGARGVRLEYTLDEGLVITEGIVPGVAKPAALVGMAEKGKVAMELSVRGAGGHSSRPPVSTAVGKLARAIHLLEANQMPARLISPVADMFEYLAPEMPFFMRAVIANRWLADPLLISRLEKSPATNASIRTTTATTVIQGGIKPNMLPTSARAVIDFRILPGDTIASVVEHVTATIDDPDVMVHQVGSEPSEPTLVSNVDTFAFTGLRKTIHQVFPDVAVAPGLVIGRTDSRHYATLADSSFRFLPMRLGSQDIKRIHGTDERIAIDNYAEIIRFYVQLLRNTAS